MAHCLLNSLAAFLLCMLFAGVLIPQILLIAFKRDLFDEPNARKIHKGAVPRLGGIAFTPVICVTLALLLGVESMSPEGNYLAEYTEGMCTTLSFGFCALFILYLVGIADDLVGVRYRAKFIIQLCCAMLLIAGGLWLKELDGLFWINSLPWWIGMPLTLVAIVYIVNAINLIDGIDGLASGLASAAVIVYGLAFVLIGNYLFAVISFAVLGVLVPFFYYNVFGDPEKRKKIFMGDTGSLTIGLLLAFLSLELYLSAGDSVYAVQINPFILAFAPLIIPCLDVVRVFMGRIRRHGNPFLPDKTHIHHKFLALGFPPRLTMVTIVCGALFVSALNIYLSQYVNVTILFLADIILWTVGNIVLTKRIRSKVDKKTLESYTEQIVDE